MPTRRLRFVSFLVTVLLCAFALRLGQVQLVYGDELREKAQAMRTKTMPLKAERGQITDRHGVAIAKSVTRYKVFADQELIEKWSQLTPDGEKKGGPRYAAELLAPLLDLNAQELAAELTKSPETDRYNKYLTIATDIPPETWDAIRALRISGIFPESTSKRMYPAGETAKSIIGAMGTDEGLSGLEYSQNSLLTGTDGSMTYEQSRNGHILPSAPVTEVPANSGHTVVSTLDMDIQWHVENALDEQLKKTGARGGYVIVQDVKTCEVIALADRSATSDDTTSITGRLGSVQDIFEPGSTAKVVTMAAALETGVATPTSKFRVPDQYTTSNGQTFRDAHEHATHNRTLTGILADSSNTGTVQIAELLTKQVRYDYLSKFGFGQRTGIELGGESRGLLAEPDQWDGRTQYSVMFGQGMAGNALQSTNVFATIANGGQQCTPHLVAGTTDQDGTYTPSPKAETRQIVSKETADAVLSMMESVVVEGSGAAGKVSGYRVAGKTGTAQAADENGQLTSFVSSFIGVAPVDDPAIVVSVILRDPKTSVYGGEVAAPVFADVMAYSLQRLEVEPTGSRPSLYPIDW
ncbi:Peptidoglycan glycosyltransferase [Jonesia denitrificans DSM 20603]|uniref:Peptidoglycan glycosyltransferase n=1 Tax=Jonesia denitrificans (strain ATCC 14870 / DSM 20603 / BCRC 15368 / CIP 55.134 / JCM 11481 / NBRC 15587 / NCTC 10816 / Prevot 55134) TaxID=471856 RepID=C7R3I8_JONDD|nr:penicillin-binding protein 2 [Jonesia denitrificans]ACV08724.1 Peptidoglycan glycosyltransferase [Jonesia denitrificans DSM 20603]SQH20713.1 Peptidoglycan synthase FtsI precursor [Jonesia denitrificans]